MPLGLLCRELSKFSVRLFVVCIGRNKDFVLVALYTVCIGIFFALRATLINTIYEDNDGTIWLSSIKGVSKFIDGKFNSFYYNL